VSILWLGTHRAPDTAFTRIETVTAFLSRHLGSRVEELSPHRSSAASARTIFESGLYMLPSTKRDQPRLSTGNDATTDAAATFASYREMSVVGSCALSSHIDSSLLPFSIRPVLLHRDRASGHQPISNIEPEHTLSGLLPRRPTVRTTVTDIVGK
jgi:hypothetical protein